MQGGKFKSENNYIIEIFYMQKGLEKIPLYSCFSNVLYSYLNSKQIHDRYEFNSKKKCERSLNGRQQIIHLNDKKLGFLDIKRRLRRTLITVLKYIK